MKELDKMESAAASRLKHMLYQIKEALISLDLKIAVKITFTALLSFYLCMALDDYLKHPEYLVAGLWSVVASIIVLQTNIGGTYKAIWNRFCGVLIGSAIGAFFAFAFGAEAGVIGIAIFLAIVSCSLLNIPESYRMAALSVAIIMLPWKLHPTSDPWLYAFFRFLDTCLGFIVAILVSNLLWPSKALTKMRLNIAETCVLLQRYFEHLLISKRSQIKSPKLTLSLEDEINQALEQSRAVLEESKVELLMRFAPAGIWIDLINCQEHLWESLRLLESAFNSSLEEVFDEGLKQLVRRIVETVDFSLKDFSEGLKRGPLSFDYASLDTLQESIVHELVRFRETRTLKKYPLDIVENYFVFFYLIKQIIAALKAFHLLLMRLIENPKALTLEES